MKNEYHNFEEGQEVICISGNFPFVPEYSKNKIDTLETKPVVGQRLIIDEILGEFLNFDCFNKKDQNGNVLIYNWFKHDRFLSTKNMIKHFHFLHENPNEANGTVLQKELKCFLKHNT